MQNTIIRKLITFLVFIAVIILIFGDFGPEGKVYDCSTISAYSDVPQEVKDECYKMRLEEFEQRYAPQVNKTDLHT